MQDLTPDMEDLLRRASENYPLSKGEDRWREIAEKLSVKTGSLAGASKKHDRKKRFFLLMFLLLFLDTSSYILINFDQSGKKHPGVKTKPGSENNTSKNDLAIREINNSRPGAKVPVHQYALENKSPVTSGSKGYNTNQQPDHGMQFISSGLTSSQYLPNRIIQVEGPLKSYSYPDHSFLTALFQQNAVPGVTQNSLNKILTKRGLYYGAVTGPVFNTVRGRGWTRPGFDAGLLLGYRFDERLSAEVSILFNQNFYESKAEHFNSKGIESMLNGGRQLNEVHGNNKVLELPLNIKWQPMKGANRFYLSGGISSFLMTRESNWYLTTINGADEMLYGKYYNKRPYLFAAAQFAAGFEKKIGRKSSLRIQPYIQVPLKGIGIGDLHLLSTGIQVGITRPVD